MNDPNRSLPFPRRASPLGLILLGIAAACGGGGGGSTPPAGPGPGGGGGGGGGTQRPANLEGTLTQLGVNTAQTARQLAPSVEVPTDYAPLGARPPLNKTSELLLFGIGRETAQPNHPALLLELTGPTGNAVADTLYAGTAAQLPWGAETRTMRSMPNTRRAPVAGDFDGDGRDELIVPYVANNELRLHIVDDQSGSYQTRNVWLGPETNVSNVAAGAGDLDGDGDDELLLALTVNNEGRLRVLRQDGQDFIPVGPVHTFPRTLLVSGSALVLQVATGNLDHDRGLEVAVTVSETTESVGTARYAVFDDLNRNLVALGQGRIEARNAAQQLRQAQSATVTIGDFDADGVGEVALAGLGAFQSGCAATEHVVMVLDDKVRGLGVRGQHVFEDWLPNVCDSGADPRVRIAHCNAVDFNGDRVPELQVNQFVFRDFPQGNAPWNQPWTVGWQLPDDIVWEKFNGEWYDRNTSSITVGDFTGDGREDIAVYRQRLRQVRVYGLVGPGANPPLQVARTIAVPNRSENEPCNPVLVRANVDSDSPVLQYSAAQYQLVYSEPIVLAVLAAPPTRTGIGQNVGASFTAFGSTNTTTTERERSITFSASASVGVNLDGGPITQSEFQMKATLTASATAAMGTAYELSKTIVFTSAPEEDTVVFTCVPIDRYTYTVLSHPDPTLVGDRVVIDLPRSPITLQAERTFYNAMVQPGALQVGSNVFQHTVGNPASYPTRADKDQRISGNRGLAIGPQSVGQGGGSTEVTLEVGNAVSRGGSLAMGFTLEVEATAGAVLAGVSVGVETESTWRITSGSSTRYTGVVGAIEAANFAANRYSFGLFTYVQNDAASGQQFQVLNYWVE